MTFVVACVLIVFELLVITIQAYIFTTLTAFYIAESISRPRARRSTTRSLQATQKARSRIGNETELATA